jgi:hypothetical protein
MRTAETPISATFGAVTRTTYVLVSLSMTTGLNAAPVNNPQPRASGIPVAPLEMIVPGSLNELKRTNAQAMPALLLLSQPAVPHSRPPPRRAGAPTATNGELDRFTRCPMPPREVRNHVAVSVGTSNSVAPITWTVVLTVPERVRGSRPRNGCAERAGYDPQPDSDDEAGAAHEPPL